MANTKGIEAILREAKRLGLPTHWETALDIDQQLLSQRQEGMPFGWGTRSTGTDLYPPSAEGREGSHKNRYGTARAQSGAQRVAALRARMYACIVNGARSGSLPTIREIGAVVGIRGNGQVDYHLSWLEEHGYIRRGGGRERALRPAAQVAGYPIVGTITQSTLRSHLSLVERGLLEGEAPYALQVEGAALIPWHICPGDVLLVKPAKDARPGELTLVVGEQDRVCVTSWEGGTSAQCVLGVVVSVVRLVGERTTEQGMRSSQCKLAEDCNNRMDV